MSDNKSIEIRIATILRNTASPAGIAKALALEKAASPMKSLAFRNLGLKASTVVAIADSLRQKNDNCSLQSISFSYNPLGDKGAIALAESLPQSIREIGLVNCGISDAGGSALLNWAKKSPKLQMICIEQNNFSDTLRKAFQKMGADHPSILVVV